MQICIPALVISIFLSGAAAHARPSAESELSDAKRSVATAQAFISWLQIHRDYFATCKPELKGNQLELCDGTSITKSVLTDLFKASPAELVAFIRKEGIKLEILCKEVPSSTFQQWCEPNANREFFKEVSSLHGQYIPEENRIVLHSDALAGSLVHEYLHYLQFKNRNRRFGREYKKERVEIQKQLIGSMNDLITKAQSLERQGKNDKLKPYINSVVTITDTMLALGVWQRLIDERNLFLVYTSFGKELGIQNSDVQLAARNIGFLCKDPSLTGLLSSSDCAAKK